MTEHTPTNKAAYLSGGANEDFKRSFSSWFWGSILAATVVHFLAFATWPDMSVAVDKLNPDITEIVNLPPRVDVPEPPAPISRPAIPVIAPGIDDSFTIPDVSFEDNPPETLPPPPDTGASSIPAPGAWTPYDVLPHIKNRDELRRALEREYPVRFRDAGIGGTTRVWFYVDETGKVARTQVHTSSGHTPLDDAALRIAPLYEFAPALNRNKPVAVWVSLDVTFRPR